MRLIFQTTFKFIARGGMHQRFAFEPVVAVIIDNLMVYIQDGVLQCLFTIDAVPIS